MLELKYVLITGVSSGIGNDAVGLLIKNGYYIFRNGSGYIGTFSLGWTVKSQKCCVRIDNEALVYVINKQTSKSKRLICWLRSKLKDNILV